MPKTHISIIESRFDYTGTRWT